MIHVEVEDEAWAKALATPAETTVHAAEAALVGVGRGLEGELTVLLTDDAGVHDLNLRFRGIDKATNVLSFPAAPTARPHLGDLALAYGVCVAEAEAQGKTLDRHLAHLVVHGVLHLVGYDHQADSDAGVMEQEETVILRGLGVPDPYAAAHEPLGCDSHG